MYECERIDDALSLSRDIAEMLIRLGCYNLEDRKSIINDASNFLGDRYMEAREDRAWEKKRKINEALVIVDKLAED